MFYCFCFERSKDGGRDILYAQFFNVDKRIKMNLQEFKQGVQTNPIDSLFCCGDAADKMAKSYIIEDKIECVVLCTS